MLHKALEESDSQSISTKITMPSKSASFIVKAKRQMYAEQSSGHASSSPSSPKEYFNLLLLVPQFSVNVAADHVHVLENGGFMAHHDGHYTFVTERSKQMIHVECEPSSVLLSCSIRKPGSIIYLESTYKYLSPQNKPFLHFSIIKFNPQQSTPVIDTKNIHVPLSQSEKLLSSTTIQNSKKMVYLTRTHPQQIQINLIPLTNTNKLLPPKPHKNQPPQFIITEVPKMSQKLTLQEGQKFIKVINSQFGDSLLIVTNLEVYMVEIEDEKQIRVVQLDVLGKLQKSRLSMAQEKQQKLENMIVDATYQVNSLRIIFATNTNYIGYIEAETIRSLTNIAPIIPTSLSLSPLKIMHLHSLPNNRLILHTQQQTVVILKNDKSGELLYQKAIKLPVPSNPSPSIKYKLSVLGSNDELILQTIVKQDSKEFLLVSKKSIAGNGSEFQEIYKSFYVSNQTIQESNSNTNHINSNETAKVALSISNGLICTLHPSANQVRFLKISSPTFSSSSTLNSQIMELFTHTFFEKPIDVSIDPYGSVVIVLFREFVKFFKFQFEEIVQFYTYNVRNVNYVSFTESGQYILLAVDDKLHFVDPYSYETAKVMEVHGDVKNVKFHHGDMEIVVKNSKSSNCAIQCYRGANSGDSSEMKKIRDIGVNMSQECYWLDGKGGRYAVVASQELIRVHLIEDTSEQILKNTDIVFEKAIRFENPHQFPTCMTLSEQFGVILLGTNLGNIYQYLWPFLLHHQKNDYFLTKCSQSQILQIQFSTSYEKIYVFAKNRSITQYKIVQYVEGQQMQNIYLINPKTLYNSHQNTKYQFANREYLYQNHTAYVLNNLQALNQSIEELEFVKDKIQDDIQQYSMRIIQKCSGELVEMENKKNGEIEQQKASIQGLQAHFNERKKQQIDNLEKSCSDYEEMKKKEKEKYEKKMIELYDQGARLRSIYAHLQKQFTMEKDRYLIENQEVRVGLVGEYQRKEREIEEKYGKIRRQADNYEFCVELQNVESEQELSNYRQSRHMSIQLQLANEQHRKQTLLGSIGSLTKEISNYNQRKDQFQTLIMETNLQIEQLLEDRKQYEKKVGYLQKQLQRKQKTIEEKEREVIRFVETASQMKKVKNTHEFELNQYETQFEPIEQKMLTMEEKVRKMNDQILSEYRSKVERQNAIEEKAKIFEKLKVKRQNAISKKLISLTKVSRFLSELTLLLENPLDSELRNKLNLAINGEVYEVNEEKIRRKEDNSKLIRKKELIRKELEENEKRQQQVVRNQNQFYRHYNDNTILVRQYNELKQWNKTLFAKKCELEKKLQQAKPMETPMRKRTASSVRELKKFSEQNLTPFQKHEREYNEMFFKGSTTETKLTRSGQSLSFLKTLMKEVDRNDSKYEKMEIIKDRVRSFVNPEMRIRKTLNTQKIMLDRQRGNSETVNN